MEIKKKSPDLRSAVKRLMTAIDKLEKTMQYCRKVTVTQQLGRHERWIKEIAEKAGVNLKY